MTNADHDEPASVIDVAQLRPVIDGALDRLNARDREVVLLRFSVTALMLRWASQAGAKLHTLLASARGNNATNEANTAAHRGASP